MLEYETVCVLQPDLPPAGLDKVREKVQKVLDEAKASVLDTKDWGKRKLAYRVGKFTFGHYLYFNYSADHGQFITELERTLKYDEGILRYLTVKIPKQAAAALAAGKPKKPALLEEASFNFEDYRPSGGDRGDRDHY